MELSDVRTAAERLTHQRLRGVITASKAHPDHFQIHLDETTASQLWAGPISGDASLACIRREDAWIVSLIDNGELKAYWTDSPDETNHMQADLIRLLLEGRFQAGNAQPMSSMYDHVRDVRQTFFETTAGPMVLHSRRLDAETKRTRYVLEVPERKLFLEFFWQDNFVDLDDVHELPGLPDLCQAPKQTPPPRIGAADAGRYFAHSGVAIYDFALQDLRACWEGFGEAIPAGSDGRFTWRLRAGEQCGPRCLALIMGSAHERNHFVQAMSTPCGLLEWRISQAIVTTAGWLTRKFVETPELARSMYLPLAEWYADKGRGLIRQELTLGPDSKKAPARAGVSQERYAEVLRESIETYYQELNTLVRFSSALSEHTLGLSMLEFVALANEAFEVLAINSDLADYPRWEAHDPELPDYLPEHALNLQEILEGDSRLLEHQILRQADATEAHCGTWKSIWKDGRYAVAYDWLLAELGSPEVARVAIEIALTTPIDLICKDAVNQGVIYVEDCLPNWRLKKVVKAVQQSAWPLERKHAERAAKRDIAYLAGIPTPGRTLMAMRGKKLTGERAWGTDTKLRGIPLELTPMEYFEYCQQELVRGLNMRSKDFLAFSHPEEGQIFQPAMEFYTDTVLCNGAPGSKYDLEFYLKILLMLIGHNITLEIFLVGGDLALPQRLEASFLRRLAEAGISAESVRWPGLRQVVEQTVGPNISHLLEW